MLALLRKHARVRKYDAKPRLKKSKHRIGVTMKEYKFISCITGNKYVKEASEEMTALAKEGWKFLAIIQQSNSEQSCILLLERDV